MSWVILGELDLCHAHTSHGTDAQHCNHTLEHGQRWECHGHSDVKGDKKGLSVQVDR